MALLEEVAFKGGVSNELIDSMLEPYFEECRYLKSALVEHSPYDNSLGLEGYNPSLKAFGEFRIKSSFYGQNSGHFNATEFMMCFNQLGYVMFAEGVKRGAMPCLNVESVKEFKEKYLNASYIGRIKNMSFRKPINPKNFRGTVQIDNIKVLGNIHYFMKGSFEDDNGGEASSYFTITIPPQRSSVA